MSSRKSGSEAASENVTKRLRKSKYYKESWKLLEEKMLGIRVLVLVDI
jgi:hypothetical protein